MPNWCEGTLKVRGSKEDIINFLKNGIKPMGHFSDSEEAEIKEEEYFMIVRTGKSGFYLNDSRRGFIEEDEICFDYEQDVLALDYKQAWGIDADELANISKSYNVDFKIYAYERGMEFNQNIEIHKGEIVKNEEIKFQDYTWECTNPNIGG